VLRGGGTAAVQVGRPAHAGAGTQLVLEIGEPGPSRRRVQDLVERQQVEVHPGDCAGEPGDVRRVLGTVLLRRAADREPADVPRPDAQRARIRLGHAPARADDLLASRRRLPDELLVLRDVGRLGRSEHAADVAPRDPAGARVLELHSEPGAARLQLDDGGDRAAGDSLERQAAARLCVQRDAEMVQGLELDAVADRLGLER
jgi:hypothetical protein